MYALTTAAMTPMETCRCGEAEDLVAQLEELREENRRLRISNEGLALEVQELRRRLSGSQQSGEPQMDVDNLLNALRESAVYVSYCNADLRYIWATHFLEGCTWKELKGKHDSEIFPAETRGLENLMLLKKKALASGSCQTDYVQIALPDRENFTWFVTTKPAFDHNHNPVGVLTTCVNISEFQSRLSQLGARGTAIECELREAVRLTEDAIRAKNIFLAIMSHEIRTPLNGLLGLAEALETSNLNKEQRELLTAIVSSGTIIADILGDILDLASMESGAMRLEALPFKPADVVQEVAKMAVAATREKGLIIHCEVSTRLPEMVVGDGLRVRQVMKYLVLNAIKFTQQGSVHIRLDTRTHADLAQHSEPGTASDLFKDNASRSTDGLYLWCQVVDTGVGIPQEAFSTLFDNFSQVNPSTTRSHGGTGLGLALCKQLVELMGGRLTVASEVGKGSVFTFSVLCKPCDQRPVSDSCLRQHLLEQGSEIQSRKEPRILLAEDNKVNVMVAISMLKRLGFTAQVVANGVEALEAIRKEKYDLVLLDVCMPLMDGLQVAYAIRKFEQTGTWPAGIWDELSTEAASTTLTTDETDCMESAQSRSVEAVKRVPIIAVTANALRSDVERCFAHGMDAFIPKPVMFQKLREILQKYLPVPEPGP